MWSINPCSARISAAIENLLAEALTLTALLGALLKEPEGQLTLQSADGRRSRRPAGLRLPRRRDPRLRPARRGPPRGPAGTADAAGPVRKGYLAITFDQPVANEHQDRAAGGQEPRRGRPELFRAVGTDPEPLVGSQPRSAATAGSRAACSCSTCRRAKKGASGCTPSRPSRLATRAILGGSVKSEKHGSRASARRPHLAPFPRGGRGADAGGDPAQSRLPLRPGICALGHRAFRRTSVKPWSETTA